jgi:hypothetical protein
MTRHFIPNSRLQRPGGPIAPPHLLDGLLVLASLPEFTRVGTADANTIAPSVMIVEKAPALILKHSRAGVSPLIA